MKKAIIHMEYGDIVIELFENEAMGIYFIADPDGYWTEIIPSGAY